MVETLSAEMLAAREKLKAKMSTEKIGGKTTLETSEDENYTRNEWRCKLHSKRVKM